MRKRVQVFFNEPSLTRQEFKDECDINNIVKNFKKELGADYLSKVQGFQGGHFGDFSNVADYRTALDQINAVKGVFDALPAVVRKRFDNDPAVFLDFCGNVQNRDQLVEMGLIEPVVQAQAVEPKTEGIAS